MDPLGVDLSPDMMPSGVLFEGSTLLGEISQPPPVAAAPAVIPAAAQPANPATAAPAVAAVPAVTEPVDAPAPIPAPAPAPVPAPPAAAAPVAAPTPQPAPVVAAPAPVPTPAPALVAAPATGEDTVIRERGEARPAVIVGRHPDKDKVTVRITLFFKQPIGVDQEHVALEVRRDAKKRVADANFVQLDWYDRRLPIARGRCKSRTPSRGGSGAHPDGRKRGPARKAQGRKRQRSAGGGGGANKRANTSHGYAPVPPMYALVANPTVTQAVPPTYVHYISVLSRYRSREPTAVAQVTAAAHESNVTADEYVARLEAMVAPVVEEAAQRLGITAGAPTAPVYGAPAFGAPGGAPGYGAGAYGAGRGW